LLYKTSAIKNLIVRKGKTIRYKIKSISDLWLETIIAPLGNWRFASRVLNTRGLKNKSIGKKPVIFVKHKNKLINHLFFILNVFFNIFANFFQCVAVGVGFLIIRDRKLF